MLPLLHRQPRGPAPPFQMRPLCSSALLTTLRPGPRGRGEERLGFWPEATRTVNNPARAPVCLRRPAGRGGNVPAVIYGELQ
eukprot:8722852-Alexandrium_andersonii.AAC.1